MKRQHIQSSLFFLYTILIAFGLFSCKSKTSEPPLFEVLDDKKTGLHFTNKLTSTPEFNLFKYMYFYNGAGVSAGDFNNDGKTDLFFASNLGENKLYLNKGDLQFKDVTAEARIPQDGGWSTGVSVVDINNDGLLDMYVCRVGRYETLNSSNQLLICRGIKDGIPFYEEKAAAYGLQFSGFSTQAVFFDYDIDGDLDMYLLNHSIHHNGNFGPRLPLLAKPHPASGDHFYRNEGNNTFTDITRQSGINSSVIGYGLGIVVADINLDGYPDIYAGNDFHENDYLYINQRNGTFKEELTSMIMHTSRYTMGVDVADANNDGYPEILSMDMQPNDPYILKRSLGEDDYDMFNVKIGHGYHYQYTRNNLQYNRGNGMFSEVGLYSGISATDWSWAPLFIDFDNDGLKDLFISNGIPKRMNDIDYINYISNEDMQDMIRNNNLDQTKMSLIDKFPQIKIPNKFFTNTGNLAFEDMESRIGNNRPTYSNGAAYADFDNDGDLDVVVNNIDEPALLYQNLSNEKNSKPFLNIELKGPDSNRNAIGARLVVFANNEIRTYEKYPVRGFLSSMETDIHVGLYNTRIDSMYLVWPDNTHEPVAVPPASSHISIRYKKGLPKFDYAKITTRPQGSAKPMTDITTEAKILHLHKENAFGEFYREPLIPHMASTEGPALAVGDINRDGLEDVFIGSSKGEKSVIFLQQPSGAFNRSAQPGLEQDSIFEDVDAAFTDVNKDGHIDLVVASGGNEYFGQEIYLGPRVYLNNGMGQFTRMDNAFTGLYLTASCIVPYDFNQDGYDDLFIGGRVVPWNYGQIPRSYLLQNDGTGKFRDVTSTLARELSQEGFITNATWCDIDRDDDSDLVVCSEWGGISAFINDKGSFTKKAMTDKKGWWNFILPCDINRDGHIDFIAGNLGLNSRLKSSEKDPVRLYYTDFDDNGKKEQVLTYTLGGKEIVFANKSDLDKQFPGLKKQFLLAEDFAKASLPDLFGKEKLRQADVLTAGYFANAVLVNKGNGQFDVQPLPWQAQLTPFRDAVVVNANNDSLPDILLVGNFYENNTEMGRYDADFGTMLVNLGKEKFSAEPLNGLQLKGQVRHVKRINIRNREAFILARNNDSTMVIRFSE